MPLPRHVRFHRRSGKWRAVISIGEGRRWYGPLRTDAERASEDAARYLASAGRVGPHATLGDAFERLRIALRQSGARAATVVFYEKTWTRLQRCSPWKPSTPIADLTPTDVRSWAEARAERGVTASTIWGKEVLTLRRMIAVAREAELVPIDPIAGLKAPRYRQGRYGVLPAKTVLELIAKVRNDPVRKKDRFVPGRDAAMLELVFGTGIRRGELARLRRRDVDVDAQILRVDGKTGIREIPLDGLGLRGARALMAEEPRADGLVYGGSVKITTAFRRFKERHGVPVSPHVLRHSFATECVRRGVQPFVLAKILGHSSLEQTMHYYTASGEDLRAAMRSIGAGITTPSPSGRSGRRSRGAS